MGTMPCSVSCGLGVAQRTVSCVQFVHSAESSVPEENCRWAAKPATSVPCLVQVCTFRWEVKAWSQVLEVIGCRCFLFIFVLKSDRIGHGGVSQIRLDCRKRQIRFEAV